MVILWTDYFIYFLVLFGGIIFINILTEPKLRNKWKKVIYRPFTLISVIILGAYLTVGVLDSIHFQEQGSLYSVLDKILNPLDSNSEKTYSRPFATHSFNKENIVLANGQTIRDYPRLQHGGIHLKATQDSARDIQFRLLNVLIQTLVIGVAFSLLWITYGAAKHKLPWDVFFSYVLKGKTRFPWRTFLLTTTLLLFVVLFIAAFKNYYHILGTGEVGEDVLYQSLKSIRTGLTIGTLTTLVMLPFALILGVMAGYFRGWIDDVIQYCYTTLSSIPAVLLIAAAVLSLQIVMDNHSNWFATVEHRADARLFALCVILGISSWAGLCRILRGETLKLRELDYIQAAQVLGVSQPSIIVKHIFPNLFHLVLITIVLDFSGLVLAEAVLSYVGVGVDPSSYSWGTMINGARMEMARIPVVWWCLTSAFIFMFILVLAANIFSDTVRDIFDPRYEEEGER